MWSQAAHSKRSYWEKTSVAWRCCFSLDLVSVFIKMEKKQAIYTQNPEQEDILQRIFEMKCQLFNVWKKLTPNYCFLKSRANYLIRNTIELDVVQLTYVLTYMIDFHDDEIVTSSLKSLTSNSQGSILRIIIASEVIWCDRFALFSKPDQKIMQHHWHWAQDLNL